MEGFPGNRPKRQESSDKPPGPKEGYRASRTPDTEIDAAMRQFMEMTRTGQVSRSDAFEEVTRDFGDKKRNDFTSQLAAAEKEVSLHHAEVVIPKRSKERKEEREAIDKEKLAMALRAFNARAVQGTSDMPGAFEEIAVEMKLTDKERAALAKGIMGALTKRDHEEEKTEPEEEIPSLVSDKAYLIPQEDVIDRLNKSGQVEDLRDQILQRLRRQNAKIKINDDGTAHIVGDARRHRAPRRGRGNPPNSQA